MFFICFGTDAGLLGSYRACPAVRRVRMNAINMFKYQGYWTSGSDRDYREVEGERERERDRQRERERERKKER